MKEKRSWWIIKSGSPLLKLTESPQLVNHAPIRLLSGNMKRREAGQLKSVSDHHVTFPSRVRSNFHFYLFFLNRLKQLFDYCLKKSVWLNRTVRWLISAPWSTSQVAILRWLPRAARCNAASRPVSGGDQLSIFGWIFGMNMLINLIEIKKLYLTMLTVYAK